jgi:hypothetical protein
LLVVRCVLASVSWPLPLTVEEERAVLQRCASETQSSMLCLQADLERATVAMAAAKATAAAAVGSMGLATNDLQEELLKQSGLLALIIRRLGALASDVSAAFSSAYDDSAKLRRKREEVKLQLLLYRELHFPKLHNQMFAHALRVGARDASLAYWQSIREQYEKQCVDLRTQKEQL